MTVDYSGHQTDEISRFSISTKAEITIQIAEREGHQFIIIKEQRPSHAPSSTEHAVEIPAALLPELKRAVAALENSFGDDDRDEEGPDLPTGPGRPMSFAHASEEEFARILDFYHINWEYEPRTFAIEWDAEGNVVSSFTPDFYLPDHDLYIELTTLKQALVTRKNRKVKLLRTLYPEVKVKVLYASDYKKLIEKFAASGRWQASRTEES
ncbi:MAG TPA: hypothetical protein VFQ92_07980 [Blastocatellia bacterium]|nr:hypothetical protein [Blastocatellia bacterium]